MSTQLSACQGAKQSNAQLLLWILISISLATINQRKQEKLLLHPLHHIVALRSKSLQTHFRHLSLLDFRQSHLNLQRRAVKTSRARRKVLLNGTLPRA